MTTWIVGYCKDDACRWVSATLRDDRFSTTHVTGEMIEHTEETGHHCHQRTHRR